MSVVYSRPMPIGPTACTLFIDKPVPKQQPDFIWPWTLNDQRNLLHLHTSRQARRQETRLLVKSVIRSFTANYTNSDNFNVDLESLLFDNDTEEPNDSGGNAGASKKRRMSTGSGSDDKSESGEQPPSKKGKGSSGADDLAEDDDGSGKEEGSDDGGDGGKGEKSKKGKGKQAAGSKQRKIDSTIPSKGSSKEADQAIASQAAEIIQANDPAMKNAQRIANKLKDLKLKEVVKPVVTDKSEAPLDVVLSKPAPPGKDIRPQARKKTGAKWTFDFKQGPSHVGKIDKLSMPVPFTALADNASKADQENLHNELARLLTSWPWNEYDLTAPLSQQIITIAMRNIWARPLQVDEVVHLDTETYRSVINYIDSRTGAHAKLTISAAATEVGMKEVSVPTLPDLNILTSSGKKVKGQAVPARTIIASTPAQPYHKTEPALKNLGPNKKSPRWAQLRAENAVYWLVAQLQGMVTTPERMKELLVMYRRQIGLQKAASTQEGIYGGKADLYTIAWNKAKLRTMVQPTKKIHDDMGLTRKELALYVHSMNASRATPVMEALIQLFCAGNDIRSVWIQAAKIADLVNLDIAAGVAPSSQCDCSESEVGVEMHPCEGCTRPTLCKTRSFDSMGRLVCNRCQQRDQGQARAGRPPRTSGETLTAYLARESLWTNFKRECVKQGADANSKDFKAIFEDAWQRLRARLPGRGVAKDLPPEKARQYTDEYTGLEHDAGAERVQTGTNPSRRRWIPHGLTIDAIRRQGHPRNSNLRHSGDNLVTTSNACQMAKQDFNAGVLHEIGEFKRLSPEEQASDKARKSLVMKVAAMAAVNCKRAYINAGKGSDEAKYEKILNEAVAGQPTPGEKGPWERKTEQYMQKTVPAYKKGGESIWDEETWQAAQDCAKSMEDYFGVTFYRLKDGTAWAGTEYTTPADLDRNGVAAFCRERLERMRTHCNKKWQTSDNDEKLYREILFQYCCSHTTKPELQHLKKKYGDRLGLPLVIWMHTPLRLSIAHRLHGFGMMTGWVSDNATDVQERLDNDENNNMLIESWFVNAAKHDMSEDYYDELDRILCAVEILDKAIYDPESAASLKSKAGVTPSTDESLEAEDEYAGASFDDDNAAVAPAPAGGVAGDPLRAADDSEAQGVAGASKDGDTEMPDIEAGAGEEEEEVEAAGAEAGDGAGADSDLNTEVNSLYSIIFSHEGLQNQLNFDPDFRVRLGELQTLANDTTNPQADEDFHVCLGGIQEDYINKALYG